MSTCIESSTSITTTALSDASTTGADYSVVVNASQTSLTVTFTGGTINKVEVTNEPAAGEGSAPATTSDAITFSINDGTPSGNVDYWIVNVDYDASSGDPRSSGDGVIIDDIPTKMPKFKPVTQCPTS